MFLTVIYILKRRDGGVTFYYTCEAGGRVGAHKRLLEGEIGIDGLEILDILGDNEEEHGGRGRGKRVKEKRMRKEAREENNKEREERKENGEWRKRKEK